MSDNKHSETTTATDARHDIPRMEPWLAVALMAFLPGIGLFILPSSALIPLYLAMGALMTTSFVMYLRTEFGRRPQPIEQHRRVDDARRSQKTDDSSALTPAA